MTTAAQSPSATPRPASPLDVSAALEQVQAAAADQRITASTAEHLTAWLTQSRYAEYLPVVLEHIAREDWKQLDDVFWTVIPFGTGGRRGAMYPIGCNAINDRTIGESAQGLADYVRAHAPSGAELACAIAYDTRHNSRHFAELCAEVMVANGFRVYFLDGYRSTPELSFTVRRQKCACGIMVTASHNPPSDNAVKAYWATGGQLLPPHDRGVIDCVMQVDAIRRANFAAALATGQVVYCQDEVDRDYLQQVVSQSRPGPRRLKVLYSPMHGVGAASVLPVLAAAGFSDVELFAPHATPDGDFPNVPEHVANPENPATFDSQIARAQESGADLVLSTDPDADRLGAAAPLGKDRRGPWRTFTGNQIGALLAEHVLARRKAAGELQRDDYVVKTLVTTELIRRIADSYGVETCGNLHVGFKWIGGLVEERGAEHFVLGTEESHGYLIGGHARDKDATVAALVLCELAAQAQAQGQTLHERLESLFWQHGVHAERTVSKSLPGATGMQRMKSLMAALRERPPARLAGLDVAQARDYQNLSIVTPSGARRPLESSRGDMVVFDLAADGNYVAVRPSGTEPKIKFYLFAFEPPELLANMADARQQVEERLDALQRDLFALVDATP